MFTDIFPCKWFSESTWELDSFIGIILTLIRWNDLNKSVMNQTSLHVTYLWTIDFWIPAILWIEWTDSMNIQLFFLSFFLEEKIKILKNCTGQFFNTNPWMQTKEIKVKHYIKHYISVTELVYMISQWYLKPYRGIWKFYFPSCKL